MAHDMDSEAKHQTLKAVKEKISAHEKNVIAQTDADYSFFDVFDTDCGQNAITLITTATLLQDGDYKYSYRWLCLDSHLQIKFFYP